MKGRVFCPVFPFFTIAIGAPFLDLEGWANWAEEVGWMGGVEMFTRPPVVKGRGSRAVWGIAVTYHLYRTHPPPFATFIFVIFTFIILFNDF